MPAVHESPSQRDNHSYGPVNGGGAGFSLLASAGGNGTGSISVAYMSRQITNEAFSILNSYENPSIHTD